MRLVSLRLVHAALASTVISALVCAFGGAAHSDPAQQLVALEVINGNCHNGLVAGLSAGQVTQLNIGTIANLTSDTYFRVPSRNIEVQLPNTLGQVIISIDLGIFEPGQVGYEVSGPNWSGSAGVGCTGFFDVK